MPHEPHNPPLAEALKAAPPQAFLREFARRYPKGGPIALDHIPDEALIREVLGRADNAFLVGTFRNDAGEHVTKYRNQGDRATVLGLLVSAADMVRDQSRKGWGEAEHWR